MASVMKRLTMMCSTKLMREVKAMKKRYINPELSISVLNTEDIMNGSDTDIDITDLFAEEE